MLSESEKLKRASTLDVSYQADRQTQTQTQAQTDRLIEADNQGKTLYRKIHLEGQRWSDTDV